MRRYAFMTSSLSATGPAALVQLLLCDVGRSRESKPRPQYGTWLHHLRDRPADCRLPSGSSQLRAALPTSERGRRVRFAGLLPPTAADVW